MPRLQSNLLDCHLPRSLLIIIATICLQMGACRLAVAQDAPSSNVAQPSMSYRVTFPDAQAHYIQVELTVRDVANEQLELFLPVWTPGSYLVREYARHIDDITATVGDGQPLPVVKSSKNTWLVSQVPKGELRVAYRLYCNELSVRTNFVDSEFGILNGAATYLTMDERLDQPHLVEFVLPEHWQQAVSSLKRSAIGDRAHTFIATNYDELVDSPVVLGNPTLHPFEVAGVNHFLVNLGGDGLWDGERSVVDVAKIVTEHQAMWDSVPYDRYYFLNVVAEKGGGLEHDHSCLLMTSRWSYRIPKSYQRWLGLVSHEFFHTWNVRRLRPTALRRYDYQSENYFDELWVAEGITSYYDSLAVARAKLTSESDYLAELSKQISSLQGTPGRLRQSLSESSHDTWIKFYRPNENSKNTTISYYNKGAIVAFLLDIEIRRRTKNAQSLDHVMRELFARFQSTGYSNQDVMTVSSEIAGSDMSDWFAEHIDSPGELNYEPALEWLGLEFYSQAESSNGRPKSAPPRTDTSKERESGGQVSTLETTDTSTEDGASPEPQAKSAEREKQPRLGGGWTGLSTSDQGGGLTVSSVVEGSPAFHAGLNVGDELLGINGFRVRGGLADRLRQYAVGQDIAILYSRRGKLQETELTLTDAPSTSWRIIKSRKPTDLQKASFEKWLAPAAR